MDATSRSLGPEASVNVGSLVAHDREHVVGENASKFLIVKLLESFIKVSVEPRHWMLLFEGSKLQLIVGNEGSNLSDEVSDCAGGESVVGKSVVEGEEELGGSAILELSHQLDASVLELRHQLS